MKISPVALAADPTTPDWVRQFIASALLHDPVDVANYTETLARVFREYAEQAFVEAGASPVPQLPFRLTESPAKYRGVTLGRLKVLSMTTEFDRIDPNGNLSAAIVETLNDRPGLSAEIIRATFPAAETQGV